MNILLFAPGFAFVYWKNLGFINSAVHGFFAVIITVVISLPFSFHHPKSYLLGAFNFSREFEWKWTVNWRMLGENIFYNKFFQSSLLILHFAVLLYFFFQKWMKITLWDAEKMAITIFSSNLIGITFSRTLHYQFLTWYHHTLPAIVFLTGLDVKQGLLILGVIEMCWNVYPSSFSSSLALLLAHVVLLGKLAFYKWKPTVSFDKTQ